MKALASHSWDLFPWFVDANLSPESSSHLAWHRSMPWSLSIRILDWLRNHPHDLNLASDTFWGTRHRKLVLLHRLFKVIWLIHATPSEGSLLNWINPAPTHPEPVTWIHRGREQNAQQMSSLRWLMQNKASGRGKDGDVTRKRRLLGSQWARIFFSRKIKQIARLQLQNIEGALWLCSFTPSDLR